MIKTHSIRDVAKALNLSICTVSKALSHADYPMAPATRKLILDKAAEMGYVPNINAKRLFSGRSGNIGLVVPDYAGSGIHCFADTHITQIVSGMEETLEAEHFRLLIIFQNEKFVRQQEFLRLFREHEVDALLIWGACSGDWSALAREKYPHLFITTYPESSSPQNRFFHDYAAGAQQVLEHFLKQGRRKILWARRKKEQAEDSLTSSVRKGMSRALKKYALEWPDAIRETDCSYGEKAAITLGEEILRSGSDPDGIIATSGLTVKILDAVFRQPGMESCRHIPLACCDSLAGDQLEFCRVEVDDLLFGRCAIENLLAQIRDPEGQSAPGPLAVRFFTGNPNL